MLDERWQAWMWSGRKWWLIGMNYISTDLYRVPT